MSQQPVGTIPDDLDLKSINGVPPATRHKLAKQGYTKTKENGPGVGRGKSITYPLEGIAGISAYADLAELGLGPESQKKILEYLQSLPAWRGRGEPEQGAVRIFLEDFPETAHFNGEQVIEGPTPGFMAGGAWITFRPRFYAAMLVLAVQVRKVAESKRFAALRFFAAEDKDLGEAASRILWRVATKGGKEIHRLEAFLGVTDDKALSTLWCEYSDFRLGWAERQG